MPNKKKTIKICQKIREIEINKASRTYGSKWKCRPRNFYMYTEKKVQHWLKPGYIKRRTEDNRTESGEKQERNRMDKTGKVGLK